MKSLLLTGGGYLSSTVSVILLGAVAWDAARADARLMAALIAGCLLSVTGMALRWCAHVNDHRRIKRAERSS